MIVFINIVIAPTIIFIIIIFLFIYIYYSIVAFPPALSVQPVEAEGFSSRFTPLWDQSFYFLLTVEVVRSL